MAHNMAYMLGQSTKLGGLPIEMLWAIGQHLDSFGMLNLRRTNDFFRGVFDDNYLGRHPHHPSDAFCNDPAHLTRLPRHLKSPFPRGNVTDLALVSASSNLAVYSTSTSPLNFKLSNLTSLTLIKVSLDGWDLLNILQSHHRTLKELNLDRVHLQQQRVWDFVLFCIDEGLRLDHFWARCLN